MFDLVESEGVCKVIELRRNGQEGRQLKLTMPSIAISITVNTTISIQQCARLSKLRIFDLRYKGSYQTSMTDYDTPPLFTDLSM